LHNVYNATAVIAALNEAGVDVNSVKEHFKTFTGMGRRFQLMAEFNGVQIFDDYAHHPTEIRAVLNSVATLSDKNIIAVFQPHRYTRLKGLWEDFLKCFESADKVYVTDVYSASEEPYEGINSANFVKALRKNNVACEHLAGNIQEVAAQLLPKLNENDLVIGLGAGTITYLGKELKKLL
jgi:UDP-N-acetylmuramate--alanine ligase